MDHTNGYDEVIPLYETITISPAFLNDHGDLLQCGKCKQNFYSIIEFLTHKKEHLNNERISNQQQANANECPSNFVSLSQLSNEIWILKDSNHLKEIEPRNENQTYFIDSSNTNVILEDHSQEYFQVNDLTNNLQCTSNASILMTDKETEKCVNSLSSFSCFKCDGCFKNVARSNDESLDKISVDCSEDKNQNGASVDVESNLKYYQCVICGRIFSNKFVLKRHLLIHMVWPNGISNTIPNDSTVNDISYECPFCHKISTTYLNFRTHLKDHKDLKVFKCIQHKCTATFVDLESLTSHIDMTHKLTEYHCHKCETIWPSLPEIATHLQSHCQTQEIIRKKLHCKYCSAIFKRKDSLKHHLETSCHLHKCKHCFKTFVNERGLRKHLLQHTNKRYKCDMCSKSFKLKHYLSSHLVTHNKARHFSCNICYKDFKRKDLLVRHIKIHQPEKFMPCPYRGSFGCSIKFTRMDKLNQHVNKKHSGEVSRNSCSEMIVVTTK